jgi:hypothetical protein
LTPLIMCMGHNAPIIALVECNFEGKDAFISSMYLFIYYYSSRCLGCFLDLCLYLFISISLFLSLYSISLSVSLSLSLYLYLFIFISISLSLCLYLYPFISIYLSIYLSFLFLAMRLYQTNTYALCSFNRWCDACVERPRWQMHRGNPVHHVLPLIPRQYSFLLLFVAAVAFITFLLAPQQCC